jgi:ribA/ribD-fused uncharacterized protein
MNIKDVRNNGDLLKAIGKGLKPKFVFFWSHKEKRDNEISKACFSQWYDSPFVVDRVKYLCAEHFMMAEKAKLFKDDEIRKKIISADNPGAAKQFGRQVRKFDENIWKKNRFEIVVKGNIEKFSQNKELLNFLISTNERVLVEASPVDKIWGIGLAVDNQNINFPEKWKGLNLLGYALMEVRSRLGK